MGQICATTSHPIYILGCGAIGFPLAAYLAHAGRHVIALRTSKNDVERQTVTVTVNSNSKSIRTPVETLSFSKVLALNGTVVVTTKSYANVVIARELKLKAPSTAVVILQNGVGVEKPFIEAGIPSIFRGVLYTTSQATSENVFGVRPVAASPIGIVRGSESRLKACVEELSTPEFPFRWEPNIQREIWKKAIINSVFNSICPLLEVDNGVFARDEAVTSLAIEIVAECVAVTDRLGLGLTVSEIVDHILRISKESDGQLISTLQDIRRGRETEIESLNIEIARIAAAMKPELSLPRTETLGSIVAAKSRFRSSVCLDSPHVARSWCQ